MRARGAGVLLAGEKLLTCPSASDVGEAGGVQ